MAGHSLWDVQEALHAVLTSATSLTAVLSDGAGGVRGFVSPDQAYPYIVLADMALRSLETQGFSGNEYTVLITAYSQSPGYRDLKAILSEIFDVLHNATFPVNNQTLVLCEHAGTEVRLEADGLTRRGTMQFRVITDPNS